MGFRLKPPTLIHGQAPSSGWCLKSRAFFVVFHTPTLLKWKERLEFEPSLAPFLYAPFLEMEHLNM